jgi:hypothetical protein
MATAASVRSDHIRPTGLGWLSWTGVVSSFMRTTVVRRPVRDLCCGWSGAARGFDKLNQRSKLNQRRDSHRMRTDFS